MSDSEEFIERGRKEVDTSNILKEKRRAKPVDAANKGYPTTVAAPQKKAKRKKGADQEVNQDADISQEENDRPKKKAAPVKNTDTGGSKQAPGQKKQSTLAKAFNHIVRRKTPTTPPRKSQSESAIPNAGPGGRKAEEASDEDACAQNKDGTLKDAADIDFFNSPSDQHAISGPSTRIARKPSTRVDSPSPSERRPQQEHAESSDDDSQQPDQDDEDDEDGEEAEVNQGGSEDTADESETEDEGLKRFYELYRRQGKRKPRKTHETRDIRPYFKPDTRKVDGVEKPGAYCQLCLSNKSIARSKAFFLGNTTSQRTHMTRFHYDAYDKWITERGLERKAKPPPNWKKAISKVKKQASIGGFTEKRIPTVKPKVTKAGILEYLIELLVDADLSFRFVERASFRRFILYLNPKLKDTDIPHKSAIAEAITRKGEILDDIDFAIIQKIPSLITLVYDGWSAMKRRNYTGVGIQYIDAPEDNENDWKIRRCLLAFEPSPGRHTGKAIGRELLGVVRKYGFSDKLGWTVGDNLTANDVGIRYMCRKLNGEGRVKKLNPKEMRGRCISHAIHLGPCHFVKALKIPGINAAKRRAQGAEREDAEGSDDEFVAPEDEQDDDFDIDMSMDVEADPTSPEDTATLMELDFEAGDVIGKLLAFVNQFHACSEPARKYFEELCRLSGIEPRRIKMWVRTRWGSLSDCFESVLYLQKPIERFCANTDFEDSIAPLRNKKTWSAYRFSASEWKIVSLSHRVLKVAAGMHSQLSADRSPTLQRVYPVLESLMSKWEQMANNTEFAPVHSAIEAALANLVKWYKSTDESSAYFIAHGMYPLIIPSAVRLPPCITVLDPVRKDRYVKVAWDKKFVDRGMAKFREFLDYKSDYDAEKKEAAKAASEKISSANKDGYNSDDDTVMADDWMDNLISTSGDLDDTDDYADDFEELNRFLGKRTLKRQDCPDPVSWWGHQGGEYPVLRKMARDYLAIPASSALIERAFSMSARTDDPRRRTIGEVKFGVVQRLRDAYREGRMEAAREAWIEIDPDFDFFDEIGEVVELLDQGDG